MKKLVKEILKNGDVKINLAIERVKKVYRTKFTLSFL